MKKLLVVLLSLGLIVAFSATASAVDVKFSGQYYVTGQFESNRGFADGGEKSLANFWQRARLQAVFQIAEGLKFTTRFDGLEKEWTGTSNSRVVTSATDDKFQRNIEWEHAYVTFKTAAGEFQVGYQDAGGWGTGFADTPYSGARIQMSKKFGDFTALAIYEKVTENNTYVTTTASNRADSDYDIYYLGGIYAAKGLQAGAVLTFKNNATTRSSTEATSYRTKEYSLQPYMKGTFGPVYVEAELQYIFGQAKEYDTTSASDLTKKGYGAYALAKVNLGPAYVGASLGYSSGDNDSTDGNDNLGPSSSTSWSPGIIFGDANYKTWSGNSDPGFGTSAGAFTNSAKQNLLAYNIFGGFNPTPKLNLDAQFWYLQADKQPTNYASKDYGMEFDVTATYKIYDNLSYMVGAGYFWTGDYFKGTSAANKVGNDYVLLNKLTLNF